MILREFLSISVGNLWRMKLRAILTASGVMIGVGALVSMLSFGFGMQKNVTSVFRKMGLFRTLQVVPVSETSGAGDRSVPRDSSRTASPPLDETAIGRIAVLDGVVMVYPQQAFDAEIRWGHRRETARVQVLPASFAEQRPFGGMVQGRFFAADTAHEAVVGAAWLRDRKVTPDSILGMSLRLDAAGGGELLLGLLRHQLLRFGFPRPLVEVAHRLGEVVLSFFRPSAVQVVVVGVAEIESGFGFRLGDILIPNGIGHDLDYLSFSDPLDMLAMLSEPPEAGWPMLIVTLDHERDYDRVQHKIEEMGYGTFSFLERFDEMRKSFLVFDAFVGVIGLIALFVAALGIVNTMVMSIVERTREIGILKSLGAREGQIRLLFLVESGTIGLAGSIGGLLLGWAVSRVASFVFQRWMIAQEIPPMDMFDLPVWVALAAVAFGVLVSVIAGLYPAARAAQVDPVQALRHD